MFQFLKRRYKNISLIFIAHDARAFIVNEQEFFKVSTSGGTLCSTAFELAYEHIQANHPPSSWNNYVFEFSDFFSVSTKTVLNFPSIILHIFLATMSLNKVIPK